MTTARYQDFQSPTVTDDGPTGALILPRMAHRLAVTGSVLVVGVIGMMVVVAALPNGNAVASKTISTDVYGRYGALVHMILLLFGLGALAIAAALAMTLQGRAGRVSAVLCGVWALASLVDAFVSTSPPGEHTPSGQFHIGLALAGLGAQVLLAVVYPAMLRRRLQRVSLPAAMTTTFVLAAGVFFAIHPADLAGLGERLLFASSALWMVVNVHLAAVIAQESGHL